MEIMTPMVIAYPVQKVNTLKMVVVAKLVNMDNPSYTDNNYFRRVIQKLANRHREEMT